MYFQCKTKACKNTHMNNSFSLYKILDAMESLEVSEAELARLAGLNQPTVHRIISGKSSSPRLANVQKIAAAVGLELADVLETSPGIRTPSGTYRVRSSVPLLSWHEVCKAAKPESYSSKENLMCPVSHSDKCVALKVEGDDMVSATGPSYPPGSIIFVEKDKSLEIKHGDRVIAKVPDDNRATFKQLVSDAGSRFLKPLNPAYEVYKGEFKILGKVIGTWIPEQ